jgi:hypothetical protein
VRQPRFYIAAAFETFPVTMVKTVLLASLVASAAAFAPSSNGESLKREASRSWNLREFEEELVGLGQPRTLVDLRESGLYKPVRALM